MKFRKPRLDLLLAGLGLCAVPTAKVSVQGDRSQGEPLALRSRLLHRRGRIETLMLADREPNRFNMRQHPSEVGLEPGDELILHPIGVGEEGRTRKIGEYDVSVGGNGPRVVRLIAMTDQMPKWKATLAYPDTLELREVEFEANRAFEVPPPFELVRVQELGTNVKIDNVNGFGAVVALALKRFNDNVLRKPVFSAYTQTESQSERDGPDDPHASVVHLKIGNDPRALAPFNRPYEYEIVVTRKRPGDPGFELPQKLNVPVPK